MTCFRDDKCILSHRTSIPPFGTVSSETPSNLYVYIKAINWQCKAYWQEKKFILSRIRNLDVCAWCARCAWCAPQKLTMNVSHSHLSLVKIVKCWAVKSRVNVETSVPVIIYNKPTRCNSGSIVFIKNYKYALHFSDAPCVHHQEHYKL